MKKLSKLFALILIIALAISVFGGCGKSETGGSDPTTTATTSQTGTSAEPGQSTERIKVSYCAWGQFPYDNNSTYIQKVNEKYNIELDMWPCYGDEFSNQVNMKLAAGDEFDVIKIGNGIDAVQLVKQDAIIEIPVEFIQKYTPNWYEDYVKVSKMPFVFSKINGKNYGWLSTSADGFYHFPIIWRSDWLKNVGIDKIPETIDEFEYAFYKFANEDPDGNQKKDTYGLSNLGMLPVFGAFGPIPYTNGGAGEMFSEVDGKIIHNATQPEMKEALKLLNKWYNDGVVDPEFVTGERTTGHWSSSQAFASGRIGYSSPGMYYNTGRQEEIGMDGRFYRLWKETQEGLGITDSDYVHGRPPIGKDGKTSGTLKWGGDAGLAFAFGKPMENDMEKQIRIAQMFDDIWMNFDNYMSVIYGTKDYDWKFDPVTGVLQDGLGPETKIANEQANVATIGLGYQFLPDISTMMKLQTPLYYGFADKVANYTEGYYDPIKPAPLDSKSKYSADLIKLTLVAYTDMITGKKPVDTYFDEYVKLWESSGGNEILKEANEYWAINGKK